MKGEIKMKGNYLSHYGILGMRWGVSRSSSKRRSSGRKESSEDHKQSRINKSKSTKELSTAELKALTNRLQLEKQYRELAPKDLRKGLSVVKSITATGATIASLYALSTTPMAQAAKKAIQIAKTNNLEKWVI